MNLPDDDMEMRKLAAVWIMYRDTVVICTVKGKSIPLQAWTGPEGSRRLRLPDFKTFCT